MNEKTIDYIHFSGSSLFKICGIRFHEFECPQSNQIAFGVKST